MATYSLSASRQTSSRGMPGSGKWAASQPTIRISLNSKPLSSLMSPTTTSSVWRMQSPERALALISLGRASRMFWTVCDIPDPLGAFAPMGGVFSCVRDLARWVDGFAAAFPPGGQRSGDPHPLDPATRREMQQPAVTMPRAQPRFPGDPAAGSQNGYGFGLFTEETSAWGRLVYHSGGYPGFGSH